MISTEFRGAIISELSFTYSPGGATAMLCELRFFDDRLYKCSARDGRPFGHSKHGPKRGLCPFREGCLPRSIFSYSPRGANVPWRIRAPIE